MALIILGFLTVPINLALSMVLWGGAIAFHLLTDDD